MVLAQQGTESPSLTFFPQGHGFAAVDHMLAVVFLCVMRCCVTSMINKAEWTKSSKSVQAAGVATHFDTVAV